MIAYLGIGTNLGDRTANLNRAVVLIAEQAGRVLACSSFVESEPWGFDSENTFLNAVVAINTPHTPHQLLAATQAIERSMGRHHKTTNGGKGFRAGWWKGTDWRKISLLNAWDSSIIECFSKSYKYEFERVCV